MVTIMLERDDAGGVSPTFIESALAGGVDQLVEVVNVIGSVARPQGDVMGTVDHMKCIDLHVAECFHEIDHRVGGGSGRCCIGHCEVLDVQHHSSEGGEWVNSTRSFFFHETP